MLFLIANDAYKQISVILEMTSWQNPTIFKTSFASEMYDEYGDEFDRIKLVTISHPLARREYMPYQIAETEDEFRAAVRDLLDY